eukprot:CAMPEP_0198679142 /NCGR_PEP_ID=MMETSP1468-20131203/2179_1 /TAXON_ID=1461545 /ORGANISM="Mantoniella sp, Strain CCMP1436" /LENGTH=82 /DNA_ID=CAMNT_0044417447 /DNA_START=377 /DNA_END=622 /DNA_ORIENTATION=+
MSLPVLRSSQRALQTPPHCIVLALHSSPCTPHASRHTPHLTRRTPHLTRRMPHASHCACPCSWLHAVRCTRHAVTPYIPGHA